VGDPTDLPLGTPDEQVLAWADREDRILVSFDRRTLPVHLAERLETELHSPGIFLLPRNSNASKVVQFLVLAAYASEPEEWMDRIEYVEP